jgi:cobyrinic acid a,c-diamide synthase
MKNPRLIISALRGGAGKTVLSLGIIAAWTKSGKTVTPFKKGPDYIDAGWLALAADRPCYNLDTFLTETSEITKSFLTRAADADISLIEGNRGLYDGIDTEGTTSTAELAKLLESPVILCIDCTKSTRTMAAAVLGCIRFDPDVRIKGVILNRVAGARHENVLRKNVELHCGIPVLGAIPKLHRQIFPERHMGLVPTPEHEWAKEAIESAADMAAQYVDLDALARTAEEASELPDLEKDRKQFAHPLPGSPKIGILKDAVFQFYYPENIEALVSAGADPVFLSPLDPGEEKHLKHLDALYIGGGFPETHARELAENAAFRQELKLLAENGFPVYAECGGLMYLGEELVLEGKSYPMTGVFPLIFGLSKRPQGHGYTVVTVDEKNPFFETGTEIRGHEFHYSKVLSWRGKDTDMVFSMKRGAGLINDRDGVCYKKVLATYTHIHALGMPSWAESMVRNAAAYQQSKK